MHTHRPGRTLARTRVHIYTHTSIHARSPRVYLVISILLSEQCICLRRRRVFDELRAAAGAYNARADHYAFFLCICMHIVCARGRTDAERNGTEHQPPHRWRETGYKHLPITRLLWLGSGRIHVLVRL